VSAEQVDLDVIRARADAATEGPWEHAGGIHGDPIVAEVGRKMFGLIIGMGNTGRPDYGRADAEFIAHARADVPALVAEVERLRTLLERNGARYCLCSRADVMHERWRAECPLHGVGLSRQLNEARAVLGAVAALADVWDANAGGSSSHAIGVRTLLAPVSGVVAKQPCRECGPGYRIGDDGCRHSAVAKHEQEVRADELRKAADDLVRYTPGTTTVNALRDWIVARADALTEGPDHG
jgi:hypothetical protein